MELLDGMKTFELPQSLSRYIFRFGKEHQLSEQELIKLLEFTVQKIQENFKEE